MALTEYRRKRDFSRTKEPRGKRVVRHNKLAFVIQKHAASHLHYDFRLELDGVLKSWAVPKGPDLDPATKRLAMHVEDHPIEYGKFEGIIPQGEYGGGTVMLWDRGTWEPVGDAKKDYRTGRLKFILHGEKLHGGWMLVRRGGRQASADERAWFLFKERDKHAGGKRPITERLPLSVATGRDLDEIAADADRIWGSMKARRVSKGGPPVARRVSEGDRKRKRRAPSLTRRATTRTPAGRSAGKVPSATNHYPPTTNHSPAAPAGVRLSHPEKILFPDQGLTKRDLAEYYLEVAKWMLPFVKDRPLALVRCPAGQGKPCFFQKHPGDGTLDHLRPVNVSETRTADYNLTIRDKGGLIELVQMGVLEIHLWGSQAKKLERPDRLIFDLDPDPSVPWSRVVQAAREVRLVLEEIGLTSFLKTTGGKGLHLVVPIQARTTWDDAKAFCKSVADLIVRAAPDRYIATMSKAARRGKIFIDYLRNGRGATAIAPYSTRSRPGAPVSVPIAWDELSPSLRSHHFTVINLPARLAKLKCDPWADLATTRQSLTKAMFERVQEGERPA